MKDLLINALPGVLSAIIASYLAARWSLKKLYSEKWWQRKEQAYSEVIEALYDLLQYCEIKKEDYGEREESEKMMELGERYSEAYWIVKKAATTGAFSLSEKAIQVLRELEERPRLDWEHNPPWDVYYHDYEFYSAALKKLLEAAKDDLKAK